MDADDWHWLDHPEMQARIEEVSDRREGRVEQFDSQEAALEYLASQV